MNFLKKIIAATTVGNATTWNATQDKFAFCLDVLEISAHDRFADEVVGDLEAAFERILKV